MRTVDVQPTPVPEIGRQRLARAGIPALGMAAPPRHPVPVRGTTAVPASASTGIADLLRGPVRNARVVLSRPDGLFLQVGADREPRVVGLLTSDAARLPLGCVLLRTASGRPLVPAAERIVARVGGGRIEVGELVVRASAWWEPRPKLPTARPALLPEGVRELRATLYGDGVPPSAFTLPGLAEGPGGPLAAMRGAVRRADVEAAMRTASRLIGAGSGLVTTGDDIVAATMAGLVLLGHPAAERFTSGVLAFAPGRTSALSLALLRHAAAGQVSGEYAAVLHGLVGTRPLGPAIAALMASRPTGGRALAVGLSTAIDLAERTARK